MTHAMFIRLNYPEDYQSLKWRLSFFEAMVVPTLLRQTVQDFDIWVYCNMVHADRIKSMSDRLKVYHGHRTDDPAVPKYNIQTRHDSDDFLHPEYVAKTQEICRAHKKETPLVVSFQPYKMDVWSGARYRHDRYNDQNTSAFQSLYIPDTAKEYRHVLSFNHRQIWQTYPDVVTVPLGYVTIGIHGMQQSTAIRGNNKPEGGVL
jgi:hypothetical protein